MRRVLRAFLFNKRLKCPLSLQSNTHKILFIEFKSILNPCKKQDKALFFECLPLLAKKRLLRIVWKNRTIQKACHLAFLSRSIFLNSTKIATKLTALLTSSMLMISPCILTSFMVKCQKRQNESSGAFAPFVLI